VSEPTARPPRALLLVANPAAPYSRALRVARTLAADGFEVEIAAVADPGLPDLERDGSIATRRYHPRGIWRRFAVGEPRPTGGGPASSTSGSGPSAGRPTFGPGGRRSTRRLRRPTSSTPSGS